MIHGVQQTFDPRALDKLPGKVELRRPLLDVRTVCSLLDLSEDDVRAEVEQGRLRWAWNLSAALNGRSYLRILTRSVVCWLKPELGQPATFDDVLMLVIPAEVRRMGSVAAVNEKETDLTDLFNTTGGHVLSLFVSGELEKVPNSLHRRGRGGSPRASLASVTRFLMNRLYP